MSTAGILIIGNEILSGKVQDENLPYLLPELRGLGVSVERVHVIPDVVEVIAEQVRTFSRDFTYVITTGGVGPTHDDVTMEGVARALDRKLTIHPRMQELLQEALKGKAPNTSLLKMCAIPEGASLVETADLWLPLVKVENIYVFPGIPRLLKKKFDAIRSHFKGRPFFLRKIFVQCIESEVVEALNALLEEFPELMLGSYPKVSEGDYRTLLTLESHDEQYVNRAVDSLTARIESSQIVRVE